MITDEMVEVARSAAFHEAMKDEGGDTMRAALEAVAPMIRAAALEESASIADGYPSEAHGSFSVSPAAASDQTAKEIAAAIRALAKGGDAK